MSQQNHNHSRILEQASYLLAPAMLFLSVMMLFRGHNYPGGGFIGSLFATAAITLMLLSKTMTHKHIIRLASMLLVTGVAALLTSLMLAIGYSKPLLTALWIKKSSLGLSIKLGTPLLFDIGIYSTVIGAMILIVQALRGCQHD